MNVTVVDYGAGNLRSVELALARCGADYSVTDDPACVVEARAIVFPGVGDGAHAMRILTERGLDIALREAFARETPILGICVGCQIVLDRSEEGDVECLGLIPGTARRFDARSGLKIPHMGWNSVRHVVGDGARADAGHWLFDGVPQDASFYFVHSYYPAPTDPAVAIAWTEYGSEFAAAVELRSLVATQFHPEKSGEVGLAVLANYLRRVGAIDSDSVAMPTGPGAGS